eukprot:4057513-Prymnesium_polylepis.1
MAALRSLFRLFRGRKLNVLRGRVDSCHYDHEQCARARALTRAASPLQPSPTVTTTSSEPRAEHYPL